MLVETEIVECAPRSNVHKERFPARGILPPDQNLLFLRKLIRRHVVIRTPQRPHIRISQLSRPFISQLHHPYVPLPHRRANRVPSGPRTLQRLRIAALTSRQFPFSPSGHHFPFP